MLRAKAGLQTEMHHPHTGNTRQYAVKLEITVIQTVYEQIQYS